ncbi:MAG: L,D-transpeptidase [Pseudolabrys sp.]|nr:L,D-transpeptidase [Pseudolabrys sp.]MDP2296377.1 L,D-transpeptidase [Pseudolabrys sp.]
MLRRLIAAAAVAAALFAAPQLAQARDIVAMRGYAPGSIVVSTSQRQLYFVLPGGRAIRYPVGVGKAGMAWHGHARIAQKDLRPAWVAVPGRTQTIPGGSPRNPMGAAAMGLDRGNYAIHGTNNPGSIGGYVSHGCIRMHNADVMDLYHRAPIGTNVYVVR